ncbi:MAG: DEAD/DEAH box helicase [Saprospiraceae bacterium]|nr:DEAD/DEAH box helicase [Saprospiraceae bacterium]
MILQHSAESKLEETDFEVPNTIQALLRPYQIEERWLAHHHANGLGACLADDMGLGKTLQTLTLLCYVKAGLKTEAIDKATQLSLFDAMPVQRTALQALIVVPYSLVFNWLAEIRKFAPSLIALNHTGVDRSKDFKILKTFDIILTSYQTLLRDEVLFSKIDFRYIVLDEAHYIKNRESKIFQVVRSLRTHYRISLSGTPIENSLSDLWSQMEFINPSILQSYAHFKKHYQDAIEKQRDEAVLSELKMLVSPHPPSHQGRST